MAGGSVERAFYVDLDGVMADFQGFVKLQFGMELDRNSFDPPGMWEAINKHEGFWASLPVMHDAMELWNGLKALGIEPAILTGWSSRANSTCEIQKRWWVADHLGDDVRCIVCRSRDKRDYGKPGDVLIDDWTRYRHLWEEMGGIFVLHTSARESLKAVEAICGGEVATSTR